MTKDLKIIITGRVLQIIIMLVSIRLLTTFLSEKEMGNYYIVLSLITFFNLVLLNPPGMYFSRHLLEWQKSKNLFNALFIFIVWMCIVALLSVPITISLYHWLGYESKFDLNMLLIYMGSAIIISTIHRNTMSGSNILGYRKEFVQFLIGTLLLGLICSAGIVYFYYAHALGWLMGIVFSEFVFLLVIFKFFIQKNRLNLNAIQSALTRERIKKILTYGLPIGLTTFLMWGQNIGYRFIVDYQYSGEVVAFIAVGLGISMAVFGSIETIAMQYFNPIFLKNILNATLEERAKAWNDIAKQMVSIYVFSLFFTVAMSELLINILVDEKFHDSYIYAMIGATIEFFRVMTNLLNNVSQSEYKTTVTIKPYLVGFIVSLGLLSSVDFGKNYFMIPMVLSLSYALVFIYMYINMKKLLDIKYEVNVFRVFLLSFPFYLVFIMDVKALSLIESLLSLSLFGLYYIYIIWRWSQKEREII